MTALNLTIFVIIIALCFDFLNGFHDSANSIATIVSTRVLTPLQAVIWAAFFNLIAAFLFNLHVAATVGKGMVDIKIVTQYVILCGLLGAIFWNLITWYFGLPSSSSHALIGGYGGAAIAKAGFSAILIAGWTKTVLFIFIAPVIGLVLAWTLRIIVNWLFRNSSHSKTSKLFRRLQLISAALYSMGHGTNDAQKTMGIITGLLLSSGYISKFEVPYWVILASGSMIALGTLFGGWRIVKTMGQKITKLNPIGGFCAETAGAITLFGSSALGIPVSTTHVITGSIVGVGTSNRLSAVRWGVAGTIVWAWILTIPMSAFVGGLLYYIVSFFIK
jgi:inorganic phosphate transporter, PiT family